MSSMLLGALLIVLGVTFVVGQVKFVPTLPGSCPDFKGVSPSQASKVEGEWFGVYFLKKGYVKKGIITCIKETVTAKPDGGFDILLSAIKDGEPKSKTMHATPIAGQTGQFTVKIDNVDATDETKVGTLVVVGDNFLVDILCGTDGTNHGYLVEVYSRQPTLDASSLDKVKSALQAVGVNDEIQAAGGC